MGSSTTYNVVINGEIVETKTKKAQAIQAGQERFDADKSVRVSVQTGAGNEVHAFEPQGTHSKPWTRTQDHNLDLEVPAGYTVAYTRTRVSALVARADDKSDWIVITPEGVTTVENTTQAREVTNALAVAHREAQAEARAAADAEKAEKKAAKAAEKAAKDAEKAAEKERKAAEKQAAKEAKEAEAAAAAAAQDAA